MIISMEAAAPTKLHLIQSNIDSIASLKWLVNMSKQWNRNVLEQISHF